jgi:nucleotide-binding universal stress UspA family protein
MGPIVLATDFTATSAPALQEALTLARALQVPLHVVHAWQPTSLVAMDLQVMSPPETVVRLENQRRASLDALLAAHANAGVALQGHLVQGDAAEEVVRYASTRGASMVVLGTHARTGLRAAFLGSVADTVVRTAPCPVLVVRVTKG